MVSRAEEVLRRRKEAEDGTAAVQDTSDPDLFTEQKKRDERRRQRKEQVLKDILATVQGREFIGDFLVECDILGDPHVPNSADSTAKNIGMQNAGRWWLKQIFDIAPDKYARMLKEARDRAEEK